MKRQRLFIVVGPNASGKSELGIKLAKKYSGEVISADSRQVYKGLDAGSGKLTKKEMRGVPHHCIDFADPKKQFTALNFKICAQEAIKDILSRGKTPIIVGGTGFYIDVALERVQLANVSPNRELRKILAKKTALELLETLKKLDPQRAMTIEQKNPRRLIRAIEIAKSRKFSDENSRWGRAIRNKSPLIANGVKEFSDEKFRLIWIGIKRSPERLKRRIHKRLLKRLPAIIREVKRLHNPPTGVGVSWKRMFELGLEYRYVSMYVRGDMEKQEMLEKLEREINKYAKRQMTWFKRNKKIRWVSSG